MCSTSWSLGRSKCWKENCMSPKKISAVGLTTCSQAKQTRQGNPNTDRDCCNVVNYQLSSQASRVTEGLALSHALQTCRNTKPTRSSTHESLPTCVKIEFSFFK